VRNSDHRISGISEAQKQKADDKGTGQSAGVPQRASMVFFARHSSLITRHFSVCLSSLAVVFLCAPQLVTASASTAPMARGECQMEPDTTSALPPSTKQLPGLLRGVGITQELNHQIPLDLPFVNQFGKPVRLGDYFGQKPVILSLVYFTCPNLCTMVENNLLQSLRRLKVFSVGREFNVVTVSFNPHDTPTMAYEKWRIYAGLYGRKRSAYGWSFLTGSQASITALCDAVGYHVNYIPSAHQYAHAVGIMVLTPQGKLSQYFYGLVYAPGQLRMALDEASNRKIGSPVDALLLFCCSYDPATGKYGLVIWHVLMIGGILTVLMVGGLVLYLVGWERRHPKAADQAEVRALEESVGVGRN
jgi:protein SCO1/2